MIQNPSGASWSVASYKVNVHLYEGEEGKSGSILFANKGHPLIVIILEIKKTEYESTKYTLFLSLITLTKITMDDSVFLIFKSLLCLYALCSFFVFIKPVKDKLTFGEVFMCISMTNLPSLSLVSVFSLWPQSWAEKNKAKRNNNSKNFAHHFRYTLS